MGPRLRLGLFPALAIILFLCIMLSHWSLLARDSGSVIHVWLNNFFSGHPGPGQVSSSRGEWPELELQPGDILLGGYPNCSYGRYTHVALYAGEGKVLEAFMDVGVIKQSYHHFRSYPYMAILRPSLTPETKAAAVDYAESKVGQVFFPLAFKRDERYWNCGKIVWKAFAEQGVEFDPIDDLWVAPDIFLQSPEVEVLYER